ncbi:MAG: hypothetical protein EOO38_32300 [Cytophagaceae bacterium]|nr:MAG: hypothetical protein EOO38_32300 [Cytophagaceae bacterium]
MPLVAHPDNTLCIAKSAEFQTAFTKLHNAIRKMCALGTVRQLEIAEIATKKIEVAYATAYAEFCQQKADDDDLLPPPTRPNAPLATVAEMYAARLVHLAARPKEEAAQLWSSRAKNTEVLASILG